MLRKIIYSAAGLILSATINAQDSSKNKFSINGSFDSYYKYDFGKNNINNLTSFTPSNQEFEIGMASILLQYKTQKTHFVLDLGWGKRAKAFAYTDSGITASIKQVYIDFTPLPNLFLTAGTWVTHIGYELLDAPLNNNYSMSYLFSTGPFSHTGIKATYNWKAHQIMIGIVNPTDYRYLPQNCIKNKSVIAQYHYTEKDLNLYLNYVGGRLIDSSKQNQLDLVVTYQANTNWLFAINSSLGLKKKNTNKLTTKPWWGTALYIKTNLGARTALALREEYFNDKNTLTSIPIGGHVFASTLSLDYQINKHLKIIPEIRTDIASTSLFKNHNEGCKQDMQALIAATYQF